MKRRQRAPETLRLVLIGRWEPSAWNRRVEDASLAVLAQANPARSTASVGNSPLIVAP